MKFFKNPGIAPSPEAAIDAIPVSIDVRQGTPRRALLGHPDQGGEKVPARFRVTDVDVWKCFEKREYAFPSRITDLNGSVGYGCFVFSFHRKEYTKT